MTHLEEAESRYKTLEKLHSEYIPGAEIQMPYALTEEFTNLFRQLKLTQFVCGEKVIEGDGWDWLFRTNREAYDRAWSLHMTPPLITQQELESVRESQRDEL